MFNDRRATFRSDLIVEAAANTVRDWGRITNASKFDIIELLTGPFQKRLPFSLEIELYETREDKVPAFVSFSRNQSHAKLNVQRSIWKLAEAHHDRARFIVAHEMGHLKLHRHDALGFSDTQASVLASLQPEDRAEPQADKFADCLLVKESLLEGFSAAEEISEFFNVPIECAERRFFEVTDKNRRRQTGDPCPECANFTLVRNGIGLKCGNCGSMAGYC